MTDIGTTRRPPGSSRRDSALAEEEARSTGVFFDRDEERVAGETAPRGNAEARGEILSLPIECFVGSLEGGVRSGDVLQLLDPGGVLVGKVTLLGDLALQCRRPAAVPADVVFGLLEEFLIPLQHPSLLSLGLEKLRQVLAQAGLRREGFL